MHIALVILIVIFLFYVHHGDIYTKEKGAQAKIYGPLSLALPSERSTRFFGATSSTHWERARRSPFKRSVTLCGDHGNHGGFSDEGTLALRCGSCVELWPRCLDKTYVLGGRGSSNQQGSHWSYTGWQAQDQGQPSQRRAKSPRAKSGRKPKSPRGRRGKQKEEQLVPDLDSPWNSKRSPSAPSTTSSSSNAQAESQL